MNKDDLKTKITELIDYYFPEMDNDPPPIYTILDALREVRNDIVDDHIELFDENDPNIFDLHKLP